MNREPDRLADAGWDRELMAAIRDLTDRRGSYVEFLRRLPALIP